MTTRPLEVEEYNKIITMMIKGFDYPEEGKIKKFRPNIKIALALQLQASLGLRIGDILELTLNNFRNGKLEMLEKKTGKLQYRDINSNIVNAVYQFAFENSIKQNSKLFNIGAREVQKQLKIITDYLELKNIGTHSFRKLYAMTVYEQNENNIELLKELLNHTSISTTERYIRVSQKAINKASKEISFIL